MEDKPFPLKKKTHSGAGRMTDTEISEVGIRHKHNAIATAILALNGLRLSVCCGSCVKINQSTCGSLFFWALQSLFI